MMDRIVARNHFAITPTNGATIYADALYVGVAGTVSCKDRDGTAATYTVPAGGQIPTNVTEVSATGTTASGIVGLLL
jgi:hypothetical protein